MLSCHSSATRESKPTKFIVGNFLRWSWVYCKFVVSLEMNVAVFVWLVWQHEGLYCHKTKVTALSAGFVNESVMPIDCRVHSLCTRQPTSDQNWLKVQASSELLRKHIIFLFSSSHTTIRRHHGTSFIGCRRGEGGASTGTGATLDWCHVTKLNKLYRHAGAVVCLQKYRPCCYNLGLQCKRHEQQMETNNLGTTYNSRNAIKIGPWI